MDIRRLADRDGDTLDQRIGIVRQCQQSRRFGRKDLADAETVLSRTAPIRRDPVAPGLGLNIEILHIGEVAGGEEAVAHIADGALDAALLVAASHRHGAGFVTIISGELDQGGMEPDGVAVAFQHRAFEIVVQKDSGKSVPCREGFDMTSQEVLHTGIEEEAQEDLARVAQYHDEGHQGTARTADREMAEVSPVDLGLFARQSAQAQIRLGWRPRPPASDDVAEVIGTAAIAAFAHHRV